MKMCKQRVLKGKRLQSKTSVFTVAIKFPYLSIFPYNFKNLSKSSAWSSMELDVT